MHENSKNIHLKNDIIGLNTFYTTKHEDTLIEIARIHGISFADILSVNGDMDPWIPGKDNKLLIPKQHILPFGKREGIIINIGDLRLYYFQGNNIIKTFPIGIGRSGWETPLGNAIIIDKKENPIWIPPESVRKEDPELPKVVAAGPDNPLGTRAIYLSMPSYLLHGTNKPYGVGMKVSHGCIRLYPEHIEELYNLVKTEDFSEICITSSASIIGDNKIEGDMKVFTEKAEGNKCPVCWKISKDNCKRHSHLKL